MISHSIHILLSFKFINPLFGVSHSCHNGLNPFERRHTLCASMKSAQFSSPLFKTHASLIFFVSGQAQHGLSFFSADVPFVGDEFIDFLLVIAILFLFDCLFCFVKLFVINIFLSFFWGISVFLLERLANVELFSEIVSV